MGSGMDGSNPSHCYISFVWTHRFHILSDISSMIPCTRHLPGKSTKSPNEETQTLGNSGYEWNFQRCPFNTLSSVFRQNGLARGHEHSCSTALVCCFHLTPHFGANLERENPSLRHLRYFSSHNCRRVADDFLKTFASMVTLILP